MAKPPAFHDLVIGLSSDPRLVRAIGHAGGCAILDLTAGGRAALDALRHRAPGGFGVRTSDLSALPPDPHTVVVPAGVPLAPVADARVLVEVTSVAQARAAARDGAHGVIAKGNEAGGPVGELSTFVLLQAVLAADLGVPVWAWGGIGVHTAAAAVAAGATGVVLDSQLALLAESDLPADVTARLERMDGSEATLSDGVRLVGGLPIGQDGFLAARFRRRYGTVARALAAISASVRVRSDGLSCPSLGTDLPIAQGPMTRVSDEPAFANAVAAEGGLPFLALALADATRTRELMDRTAALLGEKPWGVGVLGFAPEDVRTAQLDVIRELRPRAAIIAGGRPAQAAALEELGITTFLHVPSAGLLEQFLKSGARRFVFEGAECGGHVGPRNSFPLWEAQLAVLEDFLDAHPGEHVDVLFAGGVHDARSAAMVAALSASLQRRGAGVGVLMGTAYLFTEEAVAHGAIQPAFQRQVVAAEATELLVTAPGHATRCVRSQVTEDFQATGERLRADGVPERQLWEELERFNVGRLRIASKGVERRGAELVEVGEQEQLRSGLFMAGQVAVLRDGVTTIAELHAAVTAGAAEFLGREDAEPEAEPETTPADIAIVGMACVFPQAPDLESFWANVVHGVDAVTEVPKHRWDPTIYHDTGKSASKWGGFLPEIPFDPLSYGIPPSALPSIEPTQLLALEVAKRALDDANTTFDRERASVVFGAEPGSDFASAVTLKSTLPSYVKDIPPALANQLPELTEDTFPGVLANVISGRIANRLDLGGTNYTVDAACGSSLAALDVAVKELVSGTSDLVLCGGADVHNTAHDYLLFTSVGALSRTGRSRPFDSTADGIALGEGVAVVVLKRLADAERDGDRVYAVIKGVGSSSDGRSLGLTAPRPAGQRRALERAYRHAGVSPSEIGLVEAHGTGTVVGDRTELTTLTEVFLEHGARPRQAVLGSVKSQIGHTKCAAGMAGLIKAAMALHTGIAPPTLQLTKPSTAWEENTSPFQFATSAKPWTGPRRAGVSAFGFGGTNFHTVLAAHPGLPPRHGVSTWPVELFTFRRRDDAERMLTREGSLRELALLASRHSDRATGPVEIAVLASTVDELRALLTAALAGERPRGVFLRTDAEGKVAFLFPGQGSQRVGMLADLFTYFPEIQHLLDGAPAAEMFPGTAFSPEAEEAHRAALTDTRIAQPALGAAGLAMHHLLGRVGVTPDLLAGHSFGELVALCAAGAFDAETLLRLGRARAEAILASAGGDPGTMAAVTATAAQVEPLLGDGVVIANHNSPEQVVISGTTQAVTAATEKLRDAGLVVRPIEVACAFHSPVIAGAGALFAETLAQVEIRDPALPVWSNRTATAYPRHPREELADQVGAPVRFTDQIESMYAAGARIFVEAGPGTVLGRLVTAILGERPHTVVHTDGGLRGFLAAVAALAVSGVDVRTGWLFAGRAEEPVPAKKPGWTVDGQFVRTAAGDHLPGGLAPAEPVELTVSATSSPDALIAEFLRANREIVAAQRDVLLGFLGSTPAAPGPAPAVPIEASPAPQTAPVAAAAATPARRDVAELVLEVIADRTGYPADMIEPDLDLEADLSIDSIKRTEIAGELITRLGLADDTLDDLAKARTAASLAARLIRSGETGGTAHQADRNGPEVVAPKRLVVLDSPVTAHAERDAAELAGTTFRVLGTQGEHLDAVVARLGALGVTVRPDEGPADGLILLGCAETDLCEVFPALRGQLAHRPRWVCGSGTALGLRGLFRTLAREYPGSQVRLVENAGADDLVRELLIVGDEPVVVLRDGVRYAPRPVEISLGVLASNGAGPAGDGVAEAAALGLDRDSVLLLAGGARGVTVHCARALAAASRCRIELLGRTPRATEPETAEIAAALDPRALRAALAKTVRTPAEIERRTRLILAQRELEATVRELTELGSEVRYHAVDVLDSEAVGVVVKEIHTEYGRIDGVVHAAGVIEDKLVADKDSESFRRVFRTKVDGARTLLAATAALPNGPRFAVLFGSIASTFGNRGQADYAAANDALETLGAQWADQTGARALTVHWGPWAPAKGHGGMVTEQLGAEYARRGISLMDPEEGALSLLRELAWGDEKLRSVVYTASGW